MSNNGAKQNKEHILVCLSSSPSNEHIIKVAGQMALVYQGTLTGLFVETPDYPYMDKADQDRLQSNIRLAKSMGADLEQVIGEDISYQIAEFARLNGVTKIVIGQSGANKRFLQKKTLTERLFEYAPDIEIFIIPDERSEGDYQLKKIHRRRRIFSLRDVTVTLSAIIISTLLSLMFFHFGFTNVNIMTIYILGVLVTAATTEHMAYSVFSSFASVITFNFFFTEPRYTLLAYDIGYPMAFIVMFLAALLTGTMAGKLKRLAKQAADQAFRTKILLDTNQALQQADDAREILQTTLDQLTKLTGRQAKIILDEDADDAENTSDANVTAVTEYPIHIGAMSFGRAFLDISETPMDVFENSIVLSILGECALALENDFNTREKEKAAILAKNEQLRANLLRTISHDLRTPLTSISGNASNLMSNADDFSEDVKQQLYVDIYDDSMWLINLVENLLSITRMEGGDVNLHATVELLEELVAEALKHVDRRAKERTIDLKIEEDLLIIRADGKLIMQVVINLVNNAIKYTPEGSVITVTVRRNGDMAEVSIEDNGGGIPDDRKEKVFEMFYSGGRIAADGQRSMGLGLPLCREIVTAHGGTIRLEDSASGGAQFTFALPVEEVQLNE